MAEKEFFLAIHLDVFLYIASMVQDVRRLIIFSSQS